MKEGAGPHFRAMTEGECEAVLARNRVGRVAFQRDHRVDIVPIHYVLSNRVLCGRTARGTRLERTRDSLYDSWPVAFEVDEIEDLFQWRSVVAHGNVHAAAFGDDEWQRKAGDWEEAVRSFRTLMPTAFTEDDPTRFRDVVIRIDIVEISGREAIL